MNIGTPQSRKHIIEWLKPIVHLYCEQFWYLDLETRKPILDETKIIEIKEIAVWEGISAGDCWVLIAELMETPLTNTLKIRDYLRSIKWDPDWLGNVYSNKKKIQSLIKRIVQEGMRSLETHE